MNRSRDFEFFMASSIIPKHAYTKLSLHTSAYWDAFQAKFKLPGLLQLRNQCDYIFSGACGFSRSGGNHCLQNRHRTCQIRFNGFLHCQWRPVLPTWTLHHLDGHTDCILHCSNFKSGTGVLNHKAIGSIVRLHCGFTIANKIAHYLTYLHKVELFN